MQALSSSTQLQFGNLIRTIADQERHVEVMRQLLAQLQTFEPYAAFTRIDRKNRGFLLPEDALAFLIDNNIRITLTTIASFFASFVKDSFITYEDFLRLVLPSDSALRSVVIQRPNYSVPHDKLLPASVEAGLSRLIEAELKGYKKKSKEIQTLYKRKDFTLLDAFCAIDQKLTGFLTAEMLGKYLKKAGCVTSIHDPELFIRRLDLDNDGMLSYKEFEKGVTVQKECKSEQKTPSKLSAPKPRLKVSKKLPKKIDFNQTVMLHTKKSQPVADTEVAKALETKLRNYRALENIKAELVAEPDFNLVDAFRAFFDHESKGFVTFEDFYESLNLLGIKRLQFEDIQAFLREYIGKLTDTLSYAEFCEILAPKDQSLTKELYSRPSINHHSTKAFTFSSKTKLLFKLFFDLFLHCITEDSKYASLLSNSFLTQTKLRGFLTAHKISATDEELIGLFENLNKYTCYS